MPLTEPARLKHYHDEGFTIVPNVISKFEAAEMTVLLQQAIDEDLQTWKGKPGYIDEWMVHNLMVRGAPFLKLLENPVMHAYLDEGFSNTCTLYAFTSSSMPAGGTNYSHRIHVDSPRVIPGYTTNVGFIVALNDFTLENGATFMLPRSFERVDPPSEEEFFAKAERLTPSAGDGIFFNARTWHMGGENKTDTPRHAVTMNICRAYMRQRFDYPRLIPKGLIDKLGPVGRRFIGMNVRVPTSLDEYYVPPEQRLYLPGQG